MKSFYLLIGLFFPLLLSSVSLQSCAQGYRHISDINGEIERVLVSDFISSADGATKGEDLETLVVELAENMKVTCALVTGTNSNTWLRNIYQPGTDTILSYINWLSLVAKEDSINQKVRRSAFCQPGDWSRLIKGLESIENGDFDKSSFSRRENRFFGRVETIFLNAKARSLVELSKWIVSLNSRLDIRNIPRAQVNIVNLDTVKVHVPSLKSCNHCRFQGQIEPYVQDVIRIVDKGGVRIAIPTCCAPINSQSLSIASNLLNSSVIDSIVPVEYILEGGNIIATERFDFIADLELFDPFGCATSWCIPPTTFPKTKFLRRFAKDYDKTKWLKIEEGNSGLQRNGRITLPFYHLDLFLSAGEEDTVYVGRLDTSFYNKGVNKLDSLVIEEITRVNKRLDTVSRILESKDIGLHVVRLPIIPVYSSDQKGFSLDGVITFNNYLMEAYDDVRKVYVPNYNKMHSMKVNWETLIEEVEEKFNGWEVVWLDGNHSLGKASSLRCRAKVVSRTSRVK